MISSSDEFLRRRMEPVLLALRAGNFPQHASHPSQAAPLHFVTISRQTGANGWPLAERLVERLNASGQRDPPWTCWDRELVEKVAADHHISKQLIESLEDSGRSWLGELCSAISIADGSDDTFRAYRRVAMTIRALAQVGHVVIVGRGSVFITRQMPGGIHVRLVAPFERRVAEIAQRMSLSPHDARVYVQHADHARSAFYKRYWPSQTLGPESFTITLNTALIHGEDLVDCIYPLARDVTNLASEGAKPCRTH